MGQLGAIPKKKSKKWQSDKLNVDVGLNPECRIDDDDCNES